LQITENTGRQTASGHHLRYPTKKAEGAEDYDLLPFLLENK
jgi:hypothetical protein